MRARAGYISLHLPRVADFATLRPPPSLRWRLMHVFFAKKYITPNGTIVGIGFGLKQHVFCPANLRNLPRFIGELEGLFWPSGAVRFPKYSFDTGAYVHSDIKSTTMPIEEPYSGS